MSLAVPNKDGVQGIPPWQFLQSGSRSFTPLPPDAVRSINHVYTLKEHWHSKTPHHPIIPGVAFQRQCHQIQGKTSNSSNVPRCHTWHTTRGRGILPVCTGH